MMTIWTAVHRTSRSSEIIGPEERITPLQAVKAIAINGACIDREEASEGTLDAGKLADLVILDKSPLKVDPMSIRDIKVLETIKESKTIYKANCAGRDPGYGQDSAVHRDIRYNCSPFPGHLSDCP